MHTIGQNPPDATPPAGDGGDGGDGVAAVVKAKGKAKKAAKTGGVPEAADADAAEKGDKPKGDKAGGLDLQALLDEARKSLGGDAESQLS